MNRLVNWFKGLFTRNDKCRPPKYSRVSQDEKDTIIELYEAGFEITTISTITGRHYSTVYKIVKDSV